MAAGNFTQELCEQLTCSVCLDYFTDPVTADCGHSFCRACLTQSQGEPGRNTSCPLCREAARQRSAKPNQQLANMVEISKAFSLLLAEGAGGVCERHQEPLTLFCRDDKAPLCVECHRSEDHKEHRVIPVEEAAEECKEKIQAFLEKERETLVEQEKAEEQSSQACLKRLEEKKQEITSALEEMRSYLQEKEHCCLRHLAGLEEETNRRLGVNVLRFSKEISYFSSLLQDVELQSQQPPSEFLQDFRRTLSRCLKRKMRWKLVPPPELDWRLKSNTWKISVLKKRVEVLEGSLVQELNKGSVTLDPSTAHPSLVLSEDLKSVRCGSSKQSLICSPQRFDLEFGVLGWERFTSGRHCWEVEVEKLDGNEMWAVGVIQETLTRMGWIFLCPPMGVWAVGKEASRPHEILAYTFYRPTPVALPGEPRRIRVFLDYEEGRVEFFNADTDDLIFTFPPASFCGKWVRPFFWVGSGVSLNC